MKTKIKTGDKIINRIRARSVTDPGGWLAGRQVVSRNHALSPSDPLPSDLESRVKRIEDWIDFWETVETPWNKKR